MKVTYFAFLIALFLFTTCSANSEKIVREMKKLASNIEWSFSTLTTKSEEYENEDAFWTISSPNEQNVNEEVIRTFLELSIRSGADTVFIAKRNKIICEWYSDRYLYSIGAMSSTKSITSLLCGILQDKGLLNLDDSVQHYLPEWSGDLRDKVTVHHLLSMTSGMPDNASMQVIKDSHGNKTEAALSLTPEIVPGKKWVYSNVGSQLLSPIITSAAGQSVQDFADLYLFQPIGMIRTSFHEYPAGVFWTDADLKTTPRDFGRIGNLMLNNGRWNNQQIISKQYIGKALTGLPQNKEYGLLWWLYDEAPGYMTKGYLNTDMYIFPETELIIIRMQEPYYNYSGENEAIGYASNSKPLLNEFANIYDLKNCLKVLKKIKNNTILFYERDNLEKTDSNSSEEDSDVCNDINQTIEFPFDQYQPQYEKHYHEILQEALIASQNGDSNIVFELLIPNFNHPEITLEQLTASKLILSLSYYREQYYNESRNILETVDTNVFSNMEPFWEGSYKNLQDWLVEK